MLVGPSWILRSTGSPLASSIAAIMWPKRAPSVSIFEATIIGPGAPAARAGAPAKRVTATANRAVKACAVAGNARSPLPRWSIIPVAVCRKFPRGVDPAKLKLCRGAVILAERNRQVPHPAQEFGGIERFADDVVGAELACYGEDFGVVARAAARNGNDL